jgi:tetratricopeptide (TPR) repeat protein
MPSVSETMARGWQHFQAGQLVEAERLYRGVVGTDPQNADAWCILGVICGRQAKLDDAADCQRRAIRLRPQFFEAINNLGNVLWRQGAVGEAVAQYQEALRLRPDFAQGHNNLGAAYRQQGRLEDALACYQQALRLNPNYADAQSNLGDLLSMLGRFDEALAALQQAVRLAPGLAEARNNLGAVCRQLGRFPESIAAYREALRLKPSYAEAHFNLAIVYAQSGQLDQASASCREALKLRPDYTEAHFQLAQVLRAKGESEAATAEYQETIRREPQTPDAHLSRALAWLLSGNFRDGWAEYPWRWKCKDFLAPPFSSPLWDGSLPGVAAGANSAASAPGVAAGANSAASAPGVAAGANSAPSAPGVAAGANSAAVSPGGHAGRTILLYCEQGLGDTLQFIRYAPLVKKRVGTLIVACQEPLVKLLAACPGIDRLVDAGRPLPPHDAHLPLLDLPRIFGTTLETIPADVPYLFADRELTAKWRESLCGIEGLKIGIAWQGNPRYRGDQARSVPLVHFAALGRLPGVRLISLQKGPGTEQLVALSGAFEVLDLGHRLDEASGPFMDTAAVIAGLDLVITSDTATAHLAGALGVPVWVALPTASDWRWLLDRDDSPWYPTMRLFRQTRCGDWDEVFARIAAELSKLVRRAPPGAEAAGPSPQAQTSGIIVPVSPGELIDKITILQIKSVELTDPAKLRNVLYELGELSAVREQSLGGSPELDRLAAELRTVNEALWRIEDEIRMCEHRQGFGPRFVELARAVYHENDRRVALKRQINDLAGSALVEEKDYAKYQS